LPLVGIRDQKIVEIDRSAQAITGAGSTPSHSTAATEATRPAMATREIAAGDLVVAPGFIDLHVHGGDGADFMDLTPEAFRTVDLYSSHEALLLDYERALTRIDSRTGLPYDTSAHFLWIGERTRELDHAHVDFLSRVRNPIGVKLGPKTSGDDALRLIEPREPADDLPPIDVDDTDGVVPQLGNEQPSPCHIDRQMIDATCDVAQGDLGLQDQWSTLSGRCGRWTGRHQ